MRASHIATLRAWSHIVFDLACVMPGCAHGTRIGACIVFCCLHFIFGVEDDDDDTMLRDSHAPIGCRVRQCMHVRPSVDIIAQYRRRPCLAYEPRHSPHHRCCC